MDFGAAIRFPLRGERPWINVLLILVCMFIPIIGPLVVMGYGIIVEKMLVADLEAIPPTFSFEQFTKYLERGVWPFLVAMVAGLVMFPVIAVVWFCGFFLVMISASHAPWVIFIVMPIMFVSIVGLSMALQIFIVPLELKAGFEGSFQGAFDRRFVADFLARMWGTLLWVALVTALLAVAYFVVGALACFVGVYVTMALFTLTRFHLQAQLYRLYLARGGIAIPMQPEDVAAVTRAFPVEGAGGPRV